MVACRGARRRLLRRRAHFARRPAADCLQVLVERLLLPADLVWQDQEEARVAYAMALCLIQDPDMLGPFDLVERQLAAVDGPPLVWAANTLHAPHALAAALEQQVVFNGEPVEMPDLTLARARTLDVIQSTQPWFWRLSR